jgi:prepilin-type N-terminal cleavage/methylation domain-containing protein
MSSRLRRTSAADERGFSLVELVVATALMAIIVAALTTLFTSVQRSTVRQETRGRALDDIRLAMEQVTKDARQAQDVRTGSSASVLDMDTFVNGVATHVVYTASGTTFTRTVGSVTTTLLTKVASTSVFTYVPSLSSPTLISITLQVRPAQFPYDTSVVSLTSDARLRNVS